MRHMTFAFITTLILPIVVPNGAYGDEIENQVRAAGGAASIVASGSDKGASVIISGGNFTGSVAKALVSRADITKLRLEGCRIQSASIPALSELTRLDWLQLSECEFDDAAAGLEKCKSLRTLHIAISGDDVPESQIIELLTHVAKLEGIENLVVDSPQLTDKAVEQLSSLRGLKEISIYSDKITAESIQKLQNVLAICTKIVIHSNALDDSLKDTIVTWKSVRNLQLPGSKITDECVPSICKLSNLKLLQVGESGISSEGVAGIRSSINGVFVLGE